MPGGKSALETFSDEEDVFTGAARVKPSADVESRASGDQDEDKLIQGISESLC